MTLAELRIARAVAVAPFDAEIARLEREAAQAGTAAVLDALTPIGLETLDWLCESRHDVYREHLEGRVAEELLRTGVAEAPVRSDPVGGGYSIWHVTMLGKRVLVLADERGMLRKKS